jgi:hypothetical protein
MCKEKTAFAAYCAAAAADAANAANAAYYAAADAADAAVAVADAAADAADAAKRWAQRAIDRITRVLVKPAPPAAPVRKRPQNCGTGYCSCIECVMDPAPVQEPIGYFTVNNYDMWEQIDGTSGKPLYERPTAQPAVPDAITDSGEDPKYRAGWNECRETMLQILKARTL